MAEMIPESITYFPNATEGEKRFFEILKDTLKPSDEYIAWYEAIIKNRYGSELHPDFIVWGQNSGLSILEIKDWTVDYLEGAIIQTNEIKLKSGEKVKNPERQALDYMNNTMSNLKRERELVNTSGNLSGKLKFPCGYGIILPNISRNEFEIKLKNFINPDKILTADEVVKIEAGDKIILKSYLKKLRNVVFSFPPLNPEDLKILRSVLSPVVNIPFNINEKVRNDKVKILDREQEKEAYNIGPGHRIIKGVAGSGKTLLIAYRAKILKLLNPNWKILIICYNITLRNYIEKYLLKHIQLDAQVNTDDIKVKHFHNFIGDEYKIDTRILPNETWESYQKRLCDALNNKLNSGEIGGQIYDAILIDECQDLVTDYIKFLIHLLNKRSNHLLIAIDPDQNIYNYGAKISWASLGIQAIGRTKELKIAYRNTIEILDFAKKFKPNQLGTNENDINTPLFPDFYERHGDKPIIISFDSNSNIVDYIIQNIKRLTSENNIHYSEIGIIYPTKNFPYYKNLIEQLKSNSINYKVIETQADKLNFDFLSNEIKLINIHSVKGYEFKVVFLLNLENEWIFDDIRKNLLYVGITRAQDKLYILYLSNGNNLTNIRTMENILNKS